MTQVKVRRIVKKKLSLSTGATWEEGPGMPIYSRLIRSNSGKQP